LLFLPGARSRDASTRRLIQRLGHATALLLLLGIPEIAEAQYTVEASAEEYQYNCQLGNTQPGIVQTIYIRQTFNVGSTAARFKVTLEPGVEMTYLSETHPFPSTAGDTQTGISVCFGECLLGNQILATINYMTTGAGPLCGKILIVPHPNAENVDVLQCDGSPISAYIRDLHVVGPGWAGGCPGVHRFGGVSEVFDCVRLAVQQTTWGAVKALYRN
jgi:hypothetical protein